MDPNGQVCLGNIAYQQSGTDDDREWERLLKVAFGHYKNVLKIRPSNAYAANGLGVILFERGQFNDARQVFQSVRESLPDMSPACLNLAHTLVRFQSDFLCVCHHVVCEVSLWWRLSVAAVTGPA